MIANLKRHANRDATSQRGISALETYLTKLVFTAATFTFRVTFRVVRNAIAMRFNVVEKFPAYRVSGNGASQCTIN